MDRPTLVFLSLLVTLHFSFLVDFFLCHLLFLNVCEAIHFGSFLSIPCSCSERDKKSSNVSLCWVSLGAGNEGLSNGDSYFILSIIYGETRVRKGHCANRGECLS